MKWNLLICRSVFEATLAKENTSFKSKSMNKSGNDDLNGSALELQPIMDNEALIHNRVRIYQFRDIGRHINLGARWNRMSLNICPAHNIFW